MNPDQAEAQLKALARFLECDCQREIKQAVLTRIKPEFNHSGRDNLPPVYNSLNKLHTLLIEPNTDPRSLTRFVNRSADQLKRHNVICTVSQKLHIIWMMTPWGRKQLKVALDPTILHKQLGTTSFHVYCQSFERYPDLRPHPLISPAHLNNERAKRGLQPLRNANDMFRHLWYPDMLPLNTHPWLDCDDYQKRNGPLKINDPHPVISYLRQSTSKYKEQTTITEFPIPWLLRMGAHLDRGNEDHLPEVIRRIHPGLILANPLKTLGNPADSQENIVAHEKYLKKIQELFDIWPNSDTEGPLRWLDEQPYVGKLGLTFEQPASNYELWWLSGHWEALVLAELAGVEISRSRQFNNTEELYIELLETKKLKSSRQILVGLTAPLLEFFFSNPKKLPSGIGILNLVWPTPSKQSQWLHLLVQASLVVECRAPVRAYLQGLGLNAKWPRTKENRRKPRNKGGPFLLLSINTSEAEAKLASIAPLLDAERYNAILRLDAELQIRNPINWLNEQKRKHDSWIWLNPRNFDSDPKSSAIIAWAEQRGVTLHLLSDLKDKHLWKLIQK